jgi:hypothetical protein
MENITYKKSVYCQNCDFKGEIEITKGYTTEQTECPICGNAELIKDFGSVILRPDIGNYE